MSQNAAKSIGDLQWAHETLIKLIEIVQRNGFVGDPLRECVVDLSKGAISLERLIQECLIHVRRRRDD